MTVQPIVFSDELKERVREVFSSFRSDQYLNSVLERDPKEHSLSQLLKGWIELIEPPAWKILKDIKNGDTDELCAKLERLDPMQRLLEEVTTIEYRARAYAAQEALKVACDEENRSWKARSDQRQVEENWQGETRGR